MQMAAALSPQDTPATSQLDHLPAPMDPLLAAGAAPGQQATLLGSTVKGLQLRRRPLETWQQAACPLHLELAR